MLRYQTRKYTVAELFCGCGGFSRGFSRAGRFDVVFGNDIKPAALRAFAHNHQSNQDPPEIIAQDIRAVPLAKIVQALKRKGVAEGELDCLIGGPPCQGFSQMRRSEERRESAILKFGGYNRLDQDPRNDLVLRFIEMAHALRPKFLLIENVPQMQSHAHNGKRGGLLESIREILAEIGYNSTVQIINAADYGVPQLRERLVIMASRVGLATLPEPTHAAPEMLSRFSHRLAWVTVEDAIADLPGPPIGSEDSLGGGPLALYKDGNPSPYALQMRSTKTFPYNHLTRSYSQAILDTIKDMQPGETWDSASERKQREYAPLVQSLTQRGLDLSSAIEKLVKQGRVNAKFFNRYYWSAYTRLAWERPALTITANANFLGSGRFTHPTAQRGITMREAARLQSFDDDFKFITSATSNADTNNIGVGLDMIGEAVPPLLAEQIARHIATLLDQQQPAIRHEPSARRVVRPVELAYGL